MRDAIEDLRTLAKSQFEAGNLVAAGTIMAGLYFLDRQPETAVQAAVCLRNANCKAAANSVIDATISLDELEQSPHLIEAGICKLAINDADAAERLFARAQSADASAISLHWLGVAQRRQMRQSEAIRAFESALALDPALNGAKLELAGCFEELKDYERAAALYEDLKHTPALSTFACNRLGLCLVKSGRLDELARLLESDLYWRSLSTHYAVVSSLLWALKLAIEPRHEDVLKAIHACAGGGQKGLADAVLLTLLNLSDASPLRARYARSFAANRFFEAGEALARRYAWARIERRLKPIAFSADPDSLQRICAALERREPFSLIRLGDGEGNFLAPTFEASDPCLDDLCGRIIANWFGADGLDAGGAKALRTGLADAIDGADLLGIPNLARLAYERTNDLRGYWGVYFAALYVLDTLRRQQLVSAVIHQRLFNNESFLHALSRADGINTITCHPEFGPKLRAKLGVARGEDLVVPGEQGVPALSGETKRGRHYPDAFERTLAEIDAFASGDVVLVGAGLCGKIYVDRAKRKGCVALDVGAIVDYLVGVNSRSIFETPQFRNKHPQL